MTEKKETKKTTKKSKLIKASMLLPANSSDQIQNVQSFVKQVGLEFGAYTSRGTCVGVWKDEENTLHQDTNFSLELVLDKSDLPKLKKMLKELKEETNQKAMYLDYMDVELELL